MGKSKPKNLAAAEKAAARATDKKIKAELNKAAKREKGVGEWKKTWNEFAQQLAYV